MSTTVASSEKTPNGCVVGLAEEIAQAIADQEYGKKKNKLAVRIWSSFKQAGWQTGAEAGLRYFFDTSKLCEDLNTTPRSLANMRREMERDHLLTYHPNLEHVGTGWCVWNPNYHAWTRHPAGGARPGAGNPAWKTSTEQSPLESKQEYQPNSHLLKAEKHIQTVTTRLLETHSNGDSPVDVSLSNGDNSPAVTPFKRCQLASFRAAQQQVAMDEPKKGYEEEEYEEKRRIAPDVSRHVDVAPTARTADAAQGETYSAVRSREDAERGRLKAKIAELETDLTKEREHRKQQDLRIRIRVLQRTLDELPSHSQRTPAPTASAQQEAFAARWLSEQQHIAIETTTTTLDAPTPLFPDAVPPEKPDLFQTVLSWFYDPEHADARDKRKVAIALENLKQRGYDSLDDLRVAYEHWKDRSRDLKRAGVFDFAKNAAAV